MDDLFATVGNSLVHFRGFVTNPGIFPFPDAQYLTAIAGRDLNGDGLEDLVLTGTPSNSLYIARQVRSPNGHMDFEISRSSLGDHGCLEPQSIALGNVATSTFAAIACTGSSGVAVMLISTKMEPVLLEKLETSILEKKKRPIKVITAKIDAGPSDDIAVVHQDDGSVSIWHQNIPPKDPKIR